MRIPATLRFDSADPMAVTIHLHRADESDMTWTFARSILADGLLAPSGEGTVQVHPSGPDEQRQVVVSVAEAEGLVEAVFPWVDVFGFLLDTFLAVPRGSEGEHIDWPAEIHHVLPPNSTT